MKENCEVIGDNELCEQVLGVLLENGKHNVQELFCNEDNKQYISKAYDRAEKEFRVRFNQYFQRYKTKHEMLVNRKMESISYSYNRRMNMRLEELENASNPTYKILTEGKIKKLQETYDNDLARLVKERECSFSFDEPKLGGIFEIVTDS
jgi:hypothetical protein